MISKIEISHKTIIFTLVLLASIWLVLQIRDILFLVFVAFIIMSTLRPIVDWMGTKKIPRFIAALLVYVVVFGLIGFSIGGIIPALVSQTTSFAQAFPGVISRALPYWNIDLNSFSQQLAPIGENLVKVTIGIFSNIISVLMVLVISFYLLLERKHADSIVAGFVGDEKATSFIAVVQRIEGKLGSWMMGQLFLMFFIGLLSYIGLLLLGVKFALPLAIIAGLLEIVPNIGPIISAIPAMLIALSISPVMALTVGVLYIAIHQLENNVIVPLVMKKSVGLSPIITIFSLLVGGRLAGIAGAVLAIPVLLIIRELIIAIAGVGNKETK
jgi:predicted PurR-regulated permease PerM